MMGEPNNGTKIMTPYNPNADYPHNIPSSGPHIPGRAFPRVKRQSNFQITQRRICRHIVNMRNTGEHIPGTILNMIEQRADRIPVLNQRQRRKLNRQRHAAGVRGAFA